jgi:predicted nucleic acid-binding protein
MFLVDTVVISELRKSNADPKVVAWMGEQRTSDIFLSVVTIGELRRGIALREGKDPEFARTLAGWLDRILALYESRILPFDLESARRWGALSASLGNRSPDLQLAATALEHGLTVATRNVGHFTPAGVAVFDPFSGKAYPPS